MSMRRPLDIFFNIIEDGGAHRGEFDIQLGDYGEILSLFIGGVRVNGFVEVHELIELLLGQGYLIARSEKAKADFENDNSKNNTELEMEIGDIQKRDVI